MLARYGRRPFVRAAAILIGGAAGAQALNALSAPLLTRLYTPSEVGALGLFVAFVSAGSVVLSLRYDQAIVVPTDVAVAGRLAKLALLLLLPMTVVVVSVLVVLVATDTFGYGALPMWAVPVAGVSLLAVGLGSILRYWLIRIGRFDVISSVLLGQGIGRAGSQVVLGALRVGIAGLIVGDAIGRIVGLSRMARTGWRGLSTAMRSPISSTTLRVGADHAQFPLAGATSSLINTLAFQLPTPLIAGAYGLPVAGFFSLVQRVLGVPMTVLGASVGAALLGRMSQHARSAPEQADRLFRSAALGLAAIAIPIAVVVILLGPGTFEALFGAEWRMAGEIAAVMTPWYAAMLVVSPLSQVVIIYRGQISKLAYDVLSLGIAIASIALASGQGTDPVIAIWYLSLGQSAAYSVYLVILYRLVRRGRPYSAEGRDNQLDFPRSLLGGA